MTKTRAGSIVFLAAGIYGLISSLLLPMGKWNEPGAGAFPLIVSILLRLSGGFMLIPAGEKAESDWRAISRHQWTPFQIVLLTGGFIAALNRFGYLLSSSLYIFALLFWVSRYRVWIAAGLAGLIGLGSWFVFGRLFATPLPKGFLGI